MHFLDYIFIIILVYGFFSGFRTGFLAQLVGFLVLIILYFFSGIIAQFIQNQLIEANILSKQNSPIIGFVVGIIFLFLAIKIIFYSIEKFLKITMLNFFNRLAGGIFGVLKVAVFITFFIYLFEKINSIITITQTDDLQSVIYQFFKNFGTSFVAAFTS